MYLETAEVSRAPATRLDREDWVKAAWDVFVSGGIGAVTIKGVAETLGVTRGSFYHHFLDRADLLRELLRYWERELTIRIRDDVRALRLDPASTLLALARTVRERRAAAYDVRVRAWALSDPDVRDLLRQVDEFRLGYIRSQFVELGFDDRGAEARARLYLSYMAAEPATLIEQTPGILEDVLLTSHALLTRS